MKRKPNISTVTNLQLELNQVSVQSDLANPTMHVRYFPNGAAYLMALYNNALIWDSGKPEWERRSPKVCMSAIDACLPTWKRNVSYKPLRRKGE